MSVPGPLVSTLGTVTGRPCCGFPFLGLSFRVCISCARALLSNLTTVTRRPSLSTSLQQHFWLIFQSMYERARASGLCPEYRNQTPMLWIFVPELIFQGMYECAKGLALTPPTVTRRPSLLSFVAAALLANLQGMYERAKASAFGPHHRSQMPIVFDFVVAALFGDTAGSV